MPLIYESHAGSFSIETPRDFVNSKGFVDEAAFHHGFGWILSSVRGVPIATHGACWCGFRGVVAQAKENL